MSDHDMLDCAAVAPYLSPFADGELAEPLRSEVAAHVAVCDACAAQIERIRAVDQLVATLPHTTPSAGVYARILAAASRNTSADPRSVTREALPGASAAELRRRLREIVAPQPTADGADIVSVERPSAARHRARAPWLAAAIPAAAAILLIALAATLFNRFPTFPSQGATSRATPISADPVKQTQSAINALASQLAFTPRHPTYLPTGASAPRASIGPAEQVQANSRYLDVTWTFSSGPAQSLHLRELPAGLGFDGYTPANASTATGGASLTWSLPQSAGWQPLTASSCAGCLAVGETLGTMQLVLDAQPRGAATTDAVAAWLRLVSLSLDEQYLPLAVSLRAPDSSLALHYQATVSDAQGRTWQWNVRTLGALGGQQNATATGMGANVTEIVSGANAALLDNTNRTYEPLSPPLPAGLPSAQPPRGVTQPLFGASDFVAYGELWNRGVVAAKLPDGTTLANVYDLYWVNAAQPEHIYADASTGQVVALVVTPSSEHPGGVNGVQSYVSTSACQPYTITYTFIQYVTPSALPAKVFDTQQPGSDWRRGTVSPAFSCNG